MKQCTKCKQWVNESNFCKRIASKDGLYSWCKLCSQKYNITYRKNNRGRRLAYAKIRNKTYSKNNPERTTWHSMIQRCTNPKTVNYKNYGGRGIKVLYKSFEESLNDIGPKPGPEYSIDRIDNNGNYESSNCKWSTRKEQRANRRKLNGCT